MVADVVIATITLLVVTGAFPLYLRGAGVVLNSDHVTWPVLTRHLKFIGGGLTLTTLPIIMWMLPRFPARLGARRLLFLHVFLGVQAYALLLFGLTGIYHVFTTKRGAELYDVEDPETDLNDLHPNMRAWRLRIRLGVFGYLMFWVLAYLAGFARYIIIYW